MLLSLVNDVLDLNMITQGHYEAKMEQFNPKDIFDVIVDIFVP